MSERNDCKLVFDTHDSHDLYLVEFARDYNDDGTGLTIDIKKQNQSSLDYETILELDMPFLNLNQMKILRDLITSLINNDE